MSPLDLFRSQVVILKTYPEDRIPRKHSLLLFDDALLANSDSGLQSFIESFSHRVAMKSGEPLKDFKQFSKNFDLVMKAWPEPISRSQSLVVLGGGSLGDFGGFVASILKRGVSLVHVPSTWLAAMDSAHGGKNGLNYQGVKNQLGTFYPARSIFVIRDLLEAAPKDLLDQSFGELIKMALVGDSHFFKEMMLEKRAAADFVWRFLPLCIEDKYSLILQDPYESKQIRQILNFGHTFGHALEAHFSWPHGDAVLQGIFFSLQWSQSRGLLSKSLQQEIVSVIANKFDRAPAPLLQWYRPPSSKVIQKLLSADKKRMKDGDILFVFLKGIGRPVLEPVTVEDILQEAKKQNWVK
jgi:3-dehydroquinate synthase